MPRQGIGVYYQLESSLTYVQQLNLTLIYKRSDLWKDVKLCHMTASHRSLMQDLVSKQTSTSPNKCSLRLMSGKLFVGSLQNSTLNNSGQLGPHDTVHYPTRITHCWRIHEFRWIQLHMDTFHTIMEPLLTMLTTRVHDLIEPYQQPKNNRNHDIKSHPTLSVIQGPINNIMSLG